MCWLRGRVAGAVLTCLAISAGCTSGSGNGPPSSTALASSVFPSPSISRSAPGPPSSSSAAPDRPADWPAYGGDLQRSGFSASMPAASGRLAARQIPLDGQVYASPIVVGGRVIVATEHNSVYALSGTGAQLWRTILGTPTPRSALPCGNIDPLGITGTPVWDAVSRSVFVVTSTDTTVRHDVIALDPDTGRVRWRHSVDLPGTDPEAMQQRGALTVVDGKVWVPFGGLAGDCGAYKGRVVGVPVGGLPAGARPVAYTVPTTREAGIWAPPGPTVFQGRLFVAVGNGESVGPSYDYSDSVLELDGTRLVSWFSPRTWASDNRSDLDLGSQGPAIVSGKWVFIAGKSETAYVLRAADLGGIGGEVSSKRLCASFGGTAVVGDTVYVPCSDGIRAVRISSSGVLTERWHAAESIAGSPVVGGGRVYALDQDAGVLHALDPASGKAREQVAVGQTSRFAVPAISGGRLFVPTLTGLTIVDSAG